MVKNNLEEMLISKISKDYNIDKKFIIIKYPTESDDRFWIDILNPNFKGDLDNDDPILEQLTLTSNTKKI